MSRRPTTSGGTNGCPSCASSALPSSRCRPKRRASNWADLAARLVRYPVEVELDGGAFHFGQTLRRLVKKYRVRHAFYVGGGSAPLLGADEFAAYAHAVLASEGSFAANNLFSSDFV